MPDVMQSDSDILSNFFEGLRQDVIALQTDKGLLASGLSANKLRVDAPQELTRQLIDGAGYFPEQETGRAPGEMPPVQNIYDWLAFKKYGLNYKSESGRWSLAWAIAENIRKKGTFTFIRKQPTGVISEVLTNEKMLSLKAMLAKKYSSLVQSDVVKSFQ